jgi:hypothetical protein
MEGLMVYLLKGRRVRVRSVQSRAGCRFGKSKDVPDISLDSIVVSSILVAGKRSSHLSVLDSQRDGKVNKA